MVVGLSTLPALTKAVPSSGKTVLERVKEGASDYRYFPEPDIAPDHISQEWISEIPSLFSVR